MHTQIQAYTNNHEHTHITAHELRDLNTRRGPHWDLRGEDSSCRSRLSASSCSALLTHIINNLIEEERRTKVTSFDLWQALCLRPYPLVRDTSFSQWWLTTVPDVQRSKFVLGEEMERQRERGWKVWFLNWNSILMLFHSTPGRRLSLHCLSVSAISRAAYLWIDQYIQRAQCVPYLLQCRGEGMKNVHSTVFWDMLLKLLYREFSRFGETESWVR